MRIAQIAPLYESVPPIQYGGTERIVSYLTEELVFRGHDVTLFASGDSKTGARLIPGAPRNLRQGLAAKDPVAHHIRMLEMVYERLEDFDICHFHVDYLHFSMVRESKMMALTTLHGRLDIPDLVPLYETFSEMHVNSISHSQRRPLPWLNWAGTVHHGLPLGLYSGHEKPGKYLAFLGRVSPEKGLLEAIDIAEGAGIALKIAAKVDTPDEEYFRNVIYPRIERSKHVEFLGEISDKEKNDFLGNALALIFPINWPEPFGLVLIEAMACGTPVIAFPFGAVPEIVEDGVTGFIVSNVAEAVNAIDAVIGLSRKVVRSVFESRFSAPVMADKYLGLYGRLLVENGGSRRDFRTRGMTDEERTSRGRYHPAQRSVLRPSNVVAR